MLNIALFCFSKTKTAAEKILGGGFTYTLTYRTDFENLRNLEIRHPPWRIWHFSR